MSASMENVPIIVILLTPSAAIPICLKGLSLPSCPIKNRSRGKFGDTRGVEVITSGEKPNGSKVGSTFNSLGNFLLDLCFQMLITVQLLEKSSPILLDAGYWI